LAVIKQSTLFTEGTEFNSCSPLHSLVFEPNSN